MRLIFVLLFVGGCTIKGTLSDEPDYLTGWPPKPIIKPIFPTLNSCEIGAPCMVDNPVEVLKCRGVGVCEYINWSLLTYVFNYL